LFGIGGIGLEFKGSWILMAPFGLYFLGWLLLMFAVFWANFAKNIPGVVLFLVTIFFHYVITTSYVVTALNRYWLSPTEEEGLGRVLIRYPEELVFGSITYVLGNVFIWFLFFRSLSRLMSHKREFEME
jgi:hypothetical protein